MSNPVPSEEQFYSVARVAELFDVSKDTIRNWIKSGLLDAVVIAGQYRISRQSVLRLGNAKYSAR